MLQIIKSKEYLTKDYLVNYTSRSMNGRLLNSSSFFIKNENDDLIGMICINTDQSKYVELEKTLEYSLNSVREFLKQDQPHDTEEERINENLYLTAENTIEQVMFEVAGSTNLVDLKLTKKQKIEIVQKLYDKGFFELKEAISKIAEYFGMSEVSIYKYLQEVKNS